MDQFINTMYMTAVDVGYVKEIECSVCTRCGCLIAEEFKDRHKILCK